MVKLCVRNHDKKVKRWKRKCTTSLLQSNQASQISEESLSSSSESQIVSSVSSTFTYIIQGDNIDKKRLSQRHES